MFSQFIQIVLVATATAVGGVVANAVHKAAGWFKRKTGLDVERQAATIADQAVDYAEERAHQYLQANGKKLEAKAKAAIARTFAEAQARKAKLPKSVQDGIDQLIEAALGARRSSPSLARVLHQ